MTVYGIVKTSDGRLVAASSRGGFTMHSVITEPWLSGSFEEAVAKAEKLGYNCMVVELVPRANIRHERTHRTIIDPLL